MKAEFNPAFILHRKPYRETSLLLDIFTRNHGRVNLVAKGVRKKGNNRAELLQPYQRLQLAWSGKSDLMTLTGVESDKAAYTLKGSRLLTGFYLNELIIRMLHLQEAHSELFDIYDRTLELLTLNQEDEQIHIRIFEKRLLEAVGYGQVLDQDVDTGKKISTEVTYFYQVDRGPSLNMPDSPDFIQVSGLTLVELQNESISTARTREESKLLMRYILQKHIGPKPLLSRKLYKSFLDNTRMDIL